MTSATVPVASVATSAVTAVTRGVCGVCGEAFDGVRGDAGGDVRRGSGVNRAVSAPPRASLAGRTVAAASAVGRMDGVMLVAVAALA